MEVLKGITRDYIGETSGKEYISNKYGISEETLNETINEVMELIKRNGHSIIEKDDVATFMAFKVLQKRWIFDICLLSGFEWYNKYFKNIINTTGVYSVAAHNGILCGDANFFHDNSDKKNLATIVLLRDKYRPYLDVARDEVRGLTLETASEIEIIQSNLGNQGFKITGILSDFREQNYSYIVMADYCQLLSERDDLAKQLVFNTSEGFLSNESLASILLNKEKIMCKSLPKISNKVYPWEKIIIYITIYVMRF